MDASPHGVDCSAHSVVGEPKAWLRLEGLVVLALAIGLFFTTHEPWWLIPLIIFVPDIFMVGYLGNTRIGGFLYNLGHTYLLPAILCVVSLWQHSDIGLALGLLWFAHIGMDRVGGYGLKYPDSFKHTHLGSLEKKTP